MTTAAITMRGLSLEAQGLTCSFGGFLAVDRVSFRVEPGALVGVIGPNGAGKSTLFGMLTGFLQPDTGRVRLDSVDITSLQSFQRARLGIARTFQVPREFGSMSVRANLMAAVPGQTGESLLRLFTHNRRIQREEAANNVQAEETAAFLRLTSVLDLPSANLSGGQKKLLEIGRALMTNPCLMLLDEPFAGVNPV